MNKTEITNFVIYALINDFFFKWREQGRTLLTRPWFARWILTLACCLPQRPLPLSRHFPPFPLPVSLSLALSWLLWCTLPGLSSIEGKNTLFIDFISYTFMLLLGCFYVTSNLQDSGWMCHAVACRRPAERVPLDFNGAAYIQRRNFALSVFNTSSLPRVLSPQGRTSM